MGYITEDKRKVTTHRLKEMKQRGEKIAMLTAYDYTMAKIVDGAGIDVILVGDSASNVMAGNQTTLPITLDQMIYHAKSVVRGLNRALVVVDMPFGTYQINDSGQTNAIKIMKVSHADTLKLRAAKRSFLRCVISLKQVFRLWDIWVLPPIYQQIRYIQSVGGRVRKLLSMHINWRKWAVFDSIGEDSRCWPACSQRADNTYHRNWCRYADGQVLATPICLV